MVCNFRILEMEKSNAQQIIGNEKEDMDFFYELKIPKERVAVLIGKNGEIKKQVEDETSTKIEVNSEEGDVKLSGKDSLKLYSAREIVKAIARGFNPEVALLLLKPDYCFELVNITDFAKTKGSEMRLKGRVIGSEGKSRKHIENLTDSNICVYGKTIGIIAEAEKLSLCRRAIESLLKGSPHSNVYKWLEKQRRELRSIEYESKNIEDELK